MADIPQTTLLERLRSVEAKLVVGLGMETAIIAMENIDLDFYKRDYFLIAYIEELVRKHLPFPGKISGSISSSRHMANAKRAYVMILVTQLGMKKRKIAVFMDCGWRNVYNLFNDGQKLLENIDKNNLFKQRYSMILHDFNLYMKNYDRT